LGATALSASEGASICWNAPGAPEDFNNLLWPQITTCLRNSDYISVRDQNSKARLLASGVDVNVQIVPDTAWEVDALWGIDDIRLAFDQAHIRRGREPSKRSIAFHINDRYLFGLSTEELARLLDKMCESFGAVGILLAMGRCHGDHNLAVQVGEQMHSEPLIVDQPSSLCEITACLANSAAYVGSSMHGFITASAFGVPAIGVANKSVTKFEGMITTAQLQDTIFDSWLLACDSLLSIDIDAHRSHLGRVRNAIQRRLDEHWGSILACFQARQRASAIQVPKARRTRPCEPLFAYRANVLATVALEQMHAARRHRSKLARLSLAGDQRKAAREAKRK
jgi:polysaccharide pyruvyl transferase WcaK-like protein